jgi:DNA polymerase III epsilon subunit-like protein
MSNSAKFAAHILENYEMLDRLAYDMDKKKIRALKTSNPKYQMFDFEHPYYDIAKDARLAVKNYEKMVKEMKNVEIGHFTLQWEFDKLQAVNELSGKKNPYLDRLVKL